MRCSPCTVAPVPRRGFYLVGNKKPTRKVGWIARMQVGGAGAKQSRFLPDRQTGFPHSLPGQSVLAERMAEIILIMWPSC